MTIWTGAASAKRWLCKLGVGLALTAVLPGCFAHTRGEIVYDHPVAYVEDVPPRIERYPSTYYHGRPAYLVDGRWYYRHQQRWVYFRDEPVELREYRVHRAPAYARGPQRYSDVAAERRHYAREREADRRRAERDYAQHRAEQRRAEERRAAERRADARRERAREHAERREREQRAAERRAAERRVEERRAEERREQRRERVAERPRTQDAKKRDRNRHDRDERDDRRRVRD